MLNGTKELVHLFTQQTENCKGSVHNPRFFMSLLINSRLGGSVYHVVAEADNRRLQEQFESVQAGDATHVEDESLGFLGFSVMNDDRKLLAPTESAVLNKNSPSEFQTESSKSSN